MNHDNAHQHQHQHDTTSNNTEDSPPSHAHTELPASLVVTTSLVDMIGKALLSKGGGGGGDADDTAAALLELFHSAHHLMPQPEEEPSSSSGAPCADPLCIATAAVKQMQTMMMMQEMQDDHHTNTSMDQLLSYCSCRCHIDDDDTSPCVDCSVCLGVEKDGSLLDAAVSSPLRPPPPPPPDIYREDESSDVGPRILSTPVRRVVRTVAGHNNRNINISSSSTNSVVVLKEAVTLFNQALVHHVKSQTVPAKQLYQLVACAIQNLLLTTTTTTSTTSSSTTTNTPPCVTLLEIGVSLFIMRAA
jgi:hypothetical protein